MQKALIIAEAAFKREALHYFSREEMDSEERDRLYALLKDLGREARIELLAVMWLGRESECDTCSLWFELIERARVQQDSSNHDYNYIGEKLPLGSYILGGIVKLLDADPERLGG